MAAAADERVADRVDRVLRPLAAEQEAVIAAWQEAEKQGYIDWRQAPLLRRRLDASVAGASP